MEQASFCLEPKTAQELLAQYPKGLLLYYQGEVGHHPGLSGILSDALPGYLVVVTDIRPETFPNDCGLQLSNQLYSSGIPEDYWQVVLEGIGGREGLAEQVLSLMPVRTEPHIEGGMTVSVPAANSIAFSAGKIEDGQLMTQAMVDHGLRPIFLEGLNGDIGRFLSNCGHLPDQYRWLYSTWNGHKHIDLILTGIAPVSGARKKEIVWFMDEPLHKFLSSNGGLDGGLKEVRSFPNELSFRGGLNLLYVHNGSKWLVFVPSREAVGPIAEVLDEFGYEMVELGENQVGGGAGVKCRSLVINWAGDRSL